MARTRLRLPAALIVAVVVAEGAALLLRPRDGLIEPTPVPARSYFSASELERARDYRRPQAVLGWVALGLQGGLLVVLTVRPPGRLRRDFRRPAIAGAVVGAGLSLALSAVTLPVSAIARERAVEVGLSTQSWPAWAGDVAKGSLIEAVLLGVGAGLALAGMRRLPRGWWAPGAAVVVAFGAAGVYAGPVVLDPIFNRFEALPQGPTRSDVLGLAQRAGVEVGEVYVVDASRRTTAANAYVAGLGRTKRVVLYDNLLENFKRDEVRLVVAHELGHVRYDDVPNGLLFLGLVAPFAMFAVRQGVESLTPGDARGTPRTLPALALALGVVSFAVSTVSNQLSRDVERRADAYSLEQTGAVDAFVSFQRRIAVRNVSDPDPPAWSTFLRATHPPTIERIGAAEAFRRSPTRSRTRGGS